MAAAPARIEPRGHLLRRLAAGTAGSVGQEFLRSLVVELAAALGTEVSFVAELVPDRPGYARTLASRTARGIELGEGFTFALAGTCCEFAYREGIVVRSHGAGAAYPADAFVQSHGFDAYVAIVLRGSDGWPVGHLGVLSTHRLDVGEDEIAALRVFAARAGAELERRRHVAALAASRERVIEAADEERRRIGRDLHDGAQQRLVVLGQALALAERALASDPAAAARQLAAAREQVALTSRELRELARGLAPVGLEHGLGAALASLAAQAPLTLRVEAVPDERLPAVVESTVWYVVSEALSNAVKHGDAVELRVAATRADGALRLEVADDGIGGARPEAGTGLRGLDGRVAALGGTLAVFSPPGAGTRLVATIPLAQRATAARSSGSTR
jgi:signal transduction histidine kinase